MPVIDPQAALNGGSSSTILVSPRRDHTCRTRDHELREETDKNNTAAGALVQAWTDYRDDVPYKATKAGRYLILVMTFFDCQRGLSYNLTAHVHHTAKV